MPRKQKRPSLGWTFDQSVHAGSRIKCRPFFQYEREAREIAARFADRNIGVVPATLGSRSPPRKKKVK